MWMMGLILLALALPTTVAATVDVLKHPDGPTVALLLDCNSCKGDAKGADCNSGADEGFQDDKPCGQCLIKSNHPTRIPYDRDLIIMGSLKDEEGNPLKNEFIKLFLPNTWTVRTRTAADGLFRLVLGATVERKGKPIVLQLAPRTKRKSNKAEYYALFLMPDPYKPCEGTAAKP